MQVCSRTSYGHCLRQEALAFTGPWCMQPVIGDPASGQVTCLPLAAELELGGLWLKLQKVCLFLSTRFLPQVGSFTPPTQPDLSLQRDPHLQLPCRKSCRKPLSNWCNRLGHGHMPQALNVPCISPRLWGSCLLQLPRTRGQYEWSLQLAAVPTISPLPANSARCSWSQISFPYVTLCVTV